MRDADFGRLVDLYYVKLVQWIVKMNSDDLLDKKVSNPDSVQHHTVFLKTRSNLITTGLSMATEIKRTVKHLLLMYQACAMQPTSARLHDIVRCIEMLKAIEIEFRTKRFIIN
mmetsp:Transcript_20691/g.31690  ORF Transcript_20691/g.31690 Transcript_20691/m.31690 type:complete len:113 (-) Transcript_20691:1395-1733(-)